MPARQSLIGAAAGLLAGVVITAAMAVGGAFPFDPVDEGPQAQDALVEAWARSRTATYALDGFQAREKVGVGSISSPVFEVQRPPDRLRREMGSLEAVLSGRRVTCSSRPDGRYTCITAEGTVDVEAEVAEEVERLRSYVSAEVPLYRVARHRECFLLQLNVLHPNPPFGREARMCFDGESGAMRYLQVKKDDVIDTFEAYEVRAPSDADFTTERDPRFDESEVKPAPPPPTTVPEPDEPGDEAAPDQPGDATADDPADLPTDIDGLFELCHDGRGRVVHEALWDAAVSINDERWLDPGGVVGTCATRGVLLYLERGARPAG